MNFLRTCFDILFGALGWVLMILSGFVLLAVFFFERDDFTALNIAILAGFVGLFCLGAYLYARGMNR